MLSNLAAISAPAKILILIGLILIIAAIILFFAFDIPKSFKTMHYLNPEFLAEAIPVEEEMGKDEEMAKTELRVDELETVPLTAMLDLEETSTIKLTPEQQKEIEKHGGKFEINKKVILKG